VRRGSRGAVETLWVRSPWRDGARGATDAPRGARRAHGGAEYSPQAEAFPGACGSALWPPKAVRRGRLTVNDRAASRASSCGNCALSGWPGCGGRRPRLAADLPAEPGGRVACGTAPVMVPGRLGRTGQPRPGPSPATAGQAAASVTDGPRCWPSPGPGMVRPLGPTSANRGRPGAGPVPSIGARPRPPTKWADGGLSRGRVTGGAGKLKPGSINWLMAA
jgi:hypothetical protein